GEVIALLQGGARLVTLMGPGGIGKTRVAIEAASELVPAHRNGVFWVPLAPLRDPALVVETIGQTLGAKDSVASYIGDREMLLLLDNFEQVIEAAPDLPTLLESCPNLGVLVTSRERLRVRGEVEYGVLPLAEPEAIDLFCKRARVEPNASVAALCRVLDNLPLALELAAARAPVLSPRQILERVSQRLDLLKGGRDAEARQRTLRATIEWSHDLLHDDEKQLFARLAVFRGGCTLDAVEEVADADLDVMQSLVNKSLVRHTGDRFWMLETIREFALERFEASGAADEIRLRFTEHFLALAEKAFPELKGSPGDWLDLLEAEHDNLRAALDHLEAAGETQRALQLAGALYRFWYFRGHLREARERIERLLAADHEPTAARARALHGASVMAMNMGDAAEARLRAEEALPLFRDLEDGWGIAYSVFLMGMAATEVKDWSAALPFFEEARDRFREVGDGHYVLLSGDGTAWVTGELGDREGSRRRHEEVLADSRALGDEITASFQLDQLAAFVARDDGRIAEALSMLREAMEIRRRLGLPNFQVESLVRIAEVLLLGG